jgi:hypothetical protein
MMAIEKLKLYLSSRPASIIIILLSVAGRILQAIHFSSVAGDRAYQILATKNFVAGHGIRTYEVFANDLSAPHYIPLIKWPPGYSILLSPFYALCGDSFFWGSLLLDIIAAILLIWFARKIILLFKLPLYIINLYTLITGFFMYGFCTVCSSDMIGALLYEMALYFTLLFILSDTKKYSTAFIISFLLFAGGSVRYLSMPVAFVIPLYFIGCGLFQRNKAFISRGMFMMLMVTLFTAGLLIFQKFYGGAAAYVAESEKGFYPENLLRTDTFIFSSFINTGLSYVQLEKLSGLSYKTLVVNTRLIHLFIFAGVLLLFLYWFKKKRNKSISFSEHFMYIGISSSLVLFALLSYLSLTNAPIPLYPPANWTFVEESRYYFIPFLFLQQLFFIAFWHYRRTAQKWITRFLFTGMLVFLINVIHDIYFTVKIAVAKEQKSKNTNMQYHRDLLHKIIKENSGKNIITTAVDEVYFIYGALWENVPGLRDCSKLNTLQLATQKETIIFVILRQADLDGFKNFTANPETKFEGQINSLYFYTINVSPNLQ